MRFRPKLSTEFLLLLMGESTEVKVGEELAEGTGVGQPLSIKLKNVHLPHPHPNGGL